MSVQCEAAVGGQERWAIPAWQPGPVLAVSS